MNKFDTFATNQISTFIEYGNQLFILDKCYDIDLFKEYSRCYINFLINHTNYVYILHLYKLLIFEIEDYKHLIPDIIHINNYILSIIDNKIYNQLNIINGYLNFENYFKASIFIDTPNFNIIELSQHMNPDELITYLNILDNKYYHIKNTMESHSMESHSMEEYNHSLLTYKTIKKNELCLYTTYELYDYIKFFNFIGYEIYKITKIDDIKIVLEELKPMTINTEYIDTIFQIINTFYNLLNNTFKLNNYKFSIYNHIYISTNPHINIYLNKYRTHPKTHLFIYKTLVISFIIGSMIIKYNYI